MFSFTNNQVLKIKIAKLSAMAQAYNYSFSGG
jgi:hypothetical protein